MHGKDKGNCCLNILYLAGYTIFIKNGKKSSLLHEYELKTLVK